MSAEESGKRRIVDAEKNDQVGWRALSEVYYCNWSICNKKEGLWIPGITDLSAQARKCKTRKHCRKSTQSQFGKKKKMRLTLTRERKGRPVGSMQLITADAPCLDSSPW